MNQDVLRLKFVKVLDFGMKLGAVAKNINVNVMDLSRFKNNGYVYLTRENAEKLENFLNRIDVT